MGELVPGEPIWVGTRLRPFSKAEKLRHEKKAWTTIDERSDSRESQEHPGHMIL